MTSFTDRNAGQLTDHIYNLIPELMIISFEKLKGIGITGKHVFPPPGNVKLMF